MGWSCREPNREYLEFLRANLALIGLPSQNSHRWALTHPNRQDLGQSLNQQLWEGFSLPQWGGERAKSNSHSWGWAGCARRWESRINPARWPVVSSKYAAHLNHQLIPVLPHLIHTHTHTHTHLTLGLAAVQQFCYQFLIIHARGW